MSDWTDDANDAGAKGNAEAGLIDKANKPVDKKKHADSAISEFEKAAGACKKHNLLAWALWKQESAKVHRKMGDHGKAAVIEEETARELEKAAQAAAKQNDPDRAAQLERIAQGKWARASADWTNSKPAAPPADAATDQTHAADAGKQAEKWEKEAKARP